MRAPRGSRPQVEFKMSSRWSTQSAAFLQCHQTFVNATLHVITTPLGLFGLAMLLTELHPAVAVGVAVLYTGVLLVQIPARLALASGALTIGLSLVATMVDAPWWAGLIVLGAATLLQEVAHWISGEPTFQSTYIKEQGAPAQWVLHSFWVLPLVLQAFGQQLSRVARWLPRVKVLFGELPERASDLERVGQWVEAEQPPEGHTTHWWFADTPDDVQAALDRITHDEDALQVFRDAHPGCDVAVVHEMNEIYMAGPPVEGTSDTVFYTPHVDGPFAVWPGASVYRSLVGVTVNSQVETLFVHPTVDAKPRTFTLTKGEILAFDFNRELHFIRRKPDTGDGIERRCVLKVHYVVYPKGLGAYGKTLGWLTGAYDRRARALFLSTLTPETLWAKFKAQIVLAFTSFFDAITRYVGWGNLTYVAMLGLLSLAVQSPLPLLIGASFVHYLLYIFVFEFRDWISFGQFKRDAMFFKGVSYTMITAIYLSVLSFNPLSLGLMAVGYGLATAATYALGVDRTWFGVELGQLAPKRITAFPYNVVPHPMIVGAWIGLIGIALHEPFITDYPWLVPMHLLMYTIHLVQEATDPLAPGKVGPGEAPATK